MTPDFTARPLANKVIRFVRNNLVALGLTKRKYEDEFTEIFATRYWGSRESVSGGGSDLQTTRVVRAVFPGLFGKLGIRSLLDVPCGDFCWMRTVPLDGISYTGGDIVLPLVEQNQVRYGNENVRFIHLDVINDRLPAADMVLCRDCLVHLPLADAIKALRNIARSGSKWLLTTTFPSRTGNGEIAPGKWRPLNLQAAPFCLPDPNELHNEEFSDDNGAYADKSLGLWRCDAIRKAVG